MRVLLGSGKLDFPSTGNKHFQLQVTFPRLREGNVRSIPLESQLLFLGQIDLLRNWHRLGVRVASLTHGEGTQGLSEFAKLLLQKDKRIKGESTYALQVTESTDVLMTKSARNELYKKEKGLF